MRPGGPNLGKTLEKLVPPGGLSLSLWPSNQTSRGPRESLVSWSGSPKTPAPAVRDSERYQPASGCEGGVQFKLPARSVSSPNRATNCYHPAHFVTHESGLGADEATMRVIVAVARSERELISARTKAALGAAKARGAGLGDDRGYRPRVRTCQRGSDPGAPPGRRARGAPSGSK